ncbi:phosphodiester glycosidase family protein [Nocardioides ultimimeridianus]
MRLFPALLCCALPLTLAPAAAATGPGPGPTPGPHGPGASYGQRWQTSDRVVGPSRPTLPPYARPVRRTVTRYQYFIRPGVRVSSYQQRIGARSIRYYVTRIHWTTPGVGLTLAQPPHIGQVQTVRWMTHNTPRAVASVNGDFFDIGETGAPLGLGVVAGKVEHGINSGWNSAFYVNKYGVPHIDTRDLTLTAPLYPHLGLTNLNSPQVRPGGIGVYDRRWGTTGGYAWVQWQKRDIAMAHVVNHRVVAIRRGFQAGDRIVGQYLVARGAAAVRRLHRLRVGNKLWVRATVRGGPRTAITGNRFLIRRGKVVATDDTQLNPRTAVGINPAHKWVFLLTVEGRQEFSDGYTMVELAHRLRMLGCTSALNLDGGGSTTLVAGTGDNQRVLNSPSDGRPRKVANALAVTYRKPRTQHH